MNDQANQQLDCLRCGSRMRFLMRESIQLGETSFFGGDMGNFLAGSLPVTMYVCPQCGHLDLFTSRRPREDAQDEASTDGFYTPGTGPDMKCPRCGKMHPEDDAFCPLCGLRREFL